MCLAVVAYKSHAHYYAIILFNRDESYHRLSQKLHVWHDHSVIVAGRDEKHGGTWLGLSKHGKLAFVTNIRKLVSSQINLQSLQSRGSLLTQFLLSNHSVVSFLKHHQKQSHQYRMHNFFAFDKNNMGYSYSQCNKPTLFLPGIYGIGNGILKNRWEKVERAKHIFMQLLNKHTKESRLIDAFFDMLADTKRIPKNKLPCDTGFGKEREEMMSSICVCSEHYGTRCANVVLWRNDGNISMIERTFVPKTNIYDTESQYNIEVIM